MPSLYTVASAATFDKRQTYNCPSGYSYDGYYGCVSPWYLYGRWILVAAIIVGAFLLFCIFSCFTARRRRRRGLQPFRGTGWASGGPGGPNGAYPPPQNYYNNQQGYGYGQPQQGAPGGWQAPPPQYSAPPDGTHYGKSGPEQQPYGQPPTELQSPAHAYHQPGASGSYQPQHGGDGVYSPPPGPPPNKDGIIR